MIVVLFGGSSDERRVSVASAQNVARTLTGARLWFLDRGGKVHELTPAELFGHERAFERELVPTKAARFPSLTDAFESTEARDAVFYLALHGGEGEDGTVQRLLEERGLPFTGSGAVASARAFDKTTAKRLVQAAGGRVAEEREIVGKDPEGCRVALTEMLARHGEVIAKPVAGGSSIGLFRIADAARVPEVVQALAGQADARYLVEPFIRGRELTVGVLDAGGEARALPPSEVRLEAGRDFDYEGKYLGKGTVEITPAELTPAETAAAQALAVLAHQTLGCAGYTRTDMILTATGPVYLETNTLPGLTGASFIPQQLAAAGIPFPEFLEKQLDLARRRAGR